ncbi:hypothetical protein J8J40_32110, partial [Mycobacterium tuberculosis]|nr:hypothetical protein [Mycobacterium tuberculosis]
MRLLLIDEGLDGLGIHVVNDTANPVAGTLSLDILRAGAVRVAGGRAAVDVAPHGRATIDQTALLGGFFDTTYA